MIRLMHFVNKQEGNARIPDVTSIKQEFDSLEMIFNEILNHEREVTSQINNIVGRCLEEKDYSTFSFIQWYVEEQQEEEALFSSITDKFKILGTDGKSLFMIDNYLRKQAMPAQPSI